jgi:hypothetical protein
MVVRRSVGKSHYIIVGVITLLIFVLGLSIGIIIDFARLKYTEDINEQQKVDYQSLQLQYLYLSDLEDNSDSCAILRVALEESIEELSFSLEKFQKYQKDTTINEEEYMRVERKYTLDNLRYWIFSQKVKKTCDDDVVNILYFYSTEECEICPNQGTILTYFKKKLMDKLLVFPIDLDLEEDEKFLKILRIQYNITQLPTLIINDDVYPGIQTKEELSGIICQHSVNKEKCLI